MNISLTPDIYQPSVDDKGIYIDKTPKIINGIYCSCGSRKDKIYDNESKFNVHTKSKAHQRWIIHLNNNKANYYVEMVQNQKVIEQQKKIIGQLENNLQTKMLTIDYLTKQISNNESQSQINESMNEPLIDLLD